MLYIVLFPFSIMTSYAAAQPDKIICVFPCICKHYRISCAFQEFLKFIFAVSPVGGYPG